MTKLNKTNTMCHTRPDRVSMDTRIKSENAKKESGRSMTEMLGVLAIIGVLSVGGIMGYKSANDKAKANDIIDGLSQRSVILSQKVIAGTTLSLEPEFGSSDKVSGYAVIVNDEGNGNFSLKVSGLSKGVCEKALELGLKSSYGISLTDGTTETLVWDKGVKDDSKIACADTGNALVYDFDATLDGMAEVEEEVPLQWCGSVSKPGDEDAWVCEDDVWVCRSLPYAEFPCMGGPKAGKCMSSCPCDEGGEGDGWECTLGTLLCEGEGKYLCDEGPNAGQCLTTPCPCGTAPGEGDAWECNAYGTYYCDNDNNDVCASGPYVGKCMAVCDGPCAGFTATTCTTACTNNNGTAGYTYADVNTPCKIEVTAATNDGVCNGNGECVAASETCASYATCTGGKKYCQFSPSEGASEKGTGECKTLTDGTSKNGYLIGPTTDWWSASDWCAAHGKKLFTGTETPFENDSMTYWTSEGGDYMSFVVSYVPEIGGPFYGSVYSSGPATALCENK